MSSEEPNIDPTPPKPPKAVKVAVVGGGIAGIVAALRIAEKPGHTVTLYEKSDTLGGNLASREHADDGTEGVSFGTPPSLDFDVYPHMFQGWYDNFWGLLKSLPAVQKEGTGWREAHFTPFNSFSQARPHTKSKDGTCEHHFATLRLPYSPETLIENLFSGVAPPADMFVFGYASLDLQAEAIDRTERLKNLSLTGYLNSRRYMTKAAIDAYEAFILRVWGVPAYMVSASDCRAYGACCYGAGEEPCWLSTKPAAETIIKPLAAALKAAKVKVVLNCAVTKVVVEKGTVPPPVLDSAAAVATAAYAQDLSEGEAGASEPESHETFLVKSIEFAARPARKPDEPDQLVLAVPAPTLWTLVAGKEQKQKKGERIIDALVGLSGLQRIATQRLPMLYVAFDKELAGIPNDPVALFASRLNLAFTDLSKRWTHIKAFAGKTVLAVSCSEPLRLVGAEEAENALAILKELAEYLDFRAPESEADVAEGNASDVLWARFEPNYDAQISLNVVGSDKWRPPPTSPELPNLFLAGDYCQHPFGITTVEGAVATGLAAANALAKVTTGKSNSVKILPPRTLPPAAFLAMRYAFRPAAYAAMGLARVTENVSDDWDPSEPAKDEPTLGYLLKPGVKARTR